jgi:PII-like signaling protein
MNGYQLTFYTEQNRKHGHQTVCEWLLHEVRQLGIGGATVINCAEGFGHAGSHHAAHMLRLDDQPVQIILAVTEKEAMRFPIEFGVIGDDVPHKPSKHFSLFGRSTG